MINQETRQEKIKVWSYWQAIQESGLSTTEKMILTVLFTHANKKNGPNHSYPSVATIMRCASVSRATVFNKLSVLVDTGWLHRQNRFTPKGQTSNVYFMRLPPQFVMGNAWEEVELVISEDENQSPAFRLGGVQHLDSDPQNSPPPVQQLDPPRLTVRPELKYITNNYNPPISPLADARGGLSDFSDSDLEEGGDFAQSEGDYFKAQQMGGRSEGYNHTKTPTSTPRNQTSQASGQNKRRKDLKATGPEVGEEWKEYCEGEKTTKLITPKNPDALPKACETLLEKGGIIWGQVGCGKTTVLRELAESHGKECIINWPEFYGQQLERIKTPPADKMFQAESFNDFLVSRPVLVIDEVALKNTTPSEVAMMYRIINGRYALGKKTVLVTNYSPDRLRSDAGVGVQVFDRVTKGGVVVVCSWESLRGTEREQNAR